MIVDLHLCISSMPHIPMTCLYGREPSAIEDHGVSDLDDAIVFHMNSDIINHHVFAGLGCCSLGRPPSSIFYKSLVEEMARFETGTSCMGG